MHKTVCIAIAPLSWKLSLLEIRHSVRHLHDHLTFHCVAGFRRRVTRIVDGHQTVWWIQLEEDETDVCVGMCSTNDGVALTEVRNLR